MHNLIYKHEMKLSMKNKQGKWTLSVVDTEKEGRVVKKPRLSVEEGATSESIELYDSETWRRKGSLIVHGRAYDLMGLALQPHPPTAGESGSVTTHSLSTSPKARNTYTATQEWVELLQHSGRLRPFMLQLHQSLKQQAATKGAFSSSFTLTIHHLALQP